jgi:hypothetical protein
MPPQGPSIKSVPIDTTKPTVGIQCEFFLPPGIPDVPPDGVFWGTADGGVAMSPFATPPIRLLREGEEPPEGANDVLEEDEQSEHQASGVVSEDDA